MPKHSRKRRRSRSRSRSRDRWLEKKLSNMQKQLDKMQKDAQNSVNNDSDNNNNSVGPFTQVSEGEEVPLVRLDSKYYLYYLLLVHTHDIDLIFIKCHFKCL